MISYTPDINTPPFHIDLRFCVATLLPTGPPLFGILMILATLFIGIISKFIFEVRNG